MELLLTVSDVRGTQIAATQSAAEARDGYLADLDMVGPITSPEKAQEAAEAIKASTAFLRQIEISRKEVKEPVLTLGQRIDETAKSLSVELKAKTDAVSSCLAAYQMEQRRIEQEAQRKAWEREEAIRIEAETEARRIEDARRQLAEDMKNVPEWQKAVEVDASQKLEILAAQTTAAIVENRVAVQVAPKLTGLAFGNDVEFRVDDPQALYEACPMLVKLEPKMGMIKQALKDLKEGQSLPGVTHWKTSKTKVR